MASRARWSALALLLVVGLTISAGRTMSVFERGGVPDGQAETLSRIDQWSTDVMASMLGLEPGSEAHRELESQIRELLAKFGDNPTVTLLHVLPALAFLLLVPLQFSHRIRTRYTGWHRWSGRAVVLLAVPIGVSGLFFGLLMPYAGAVEASAVAAFGGLFFVSLGCGFVAIRRGDMGRHREWMIRMCAVALGISTVRLTGLGLALLTGAGPELWFGWSVWIGFGTTVAAAEAGIRHARTLRGGGSAAAASATGPS